MKNSRRIAASSCKKINIPAVLFTAATVLIICFIFSNSLQSRTVSSAQSGRVLQLFQRLFDPNGNIPEESFHRFVRKLAHFIEFAALGMSACGLFLSLPSKSGRYNFGMMLFLVLAVAVTDEFIQSFTGRYQRAGCHT